MYINTYLYILYKVKTIDIHVFFYELNMQLYILTLRNVRGYRTEIINRRTDKH